MATRTILTEGEPSLFKKSRAVTDFNARLHTLLDDMRETLKGAEGVGLAAPQVGVLRRAVLVLETNVDKENGEEEWYLELINPALLETEGEQDGAEGCLSIPGLYGYVKRPERVIVRAQNRDGTVFAYEGHGLTARAICHEIDHLEGKLFRSLAEGELMTSEEIDAIEKEKETAKGKEAKTGKEKAL
ncbi:MAG: peptide deformylase [Firmicutes bacterium]|nr:peptide deformylase [Bacillota bacterium]